MKAPQINATAEELRKHLRYEPETGLFFYTALRSPTCNVSGIAGCITSVGYIRVSVNGKQMQSHRLAFLFMTGEWPKGVVDHIDGVKTNNKWTNLRDVTTKTNTYNIHKVPAGKVHSKLIGAHWCKRVKRWKTAIKVSGRSIHLGTFDTEEEASEAYMNAKTAFHHGFDRANFQSGAQA